MSGSILFSFQVSLLSTTRLKNSIVSSLGSSMTALKLDFTLPSDCAPLLTEYRYPGYNPYPYKQATDPTCGWRNHEIIHTAFITPDKYNDPDIICHVGATHATEYVEAVAGEVVTIQWTPWPPSHYGPVITYMASCNGDCLTVNKEDLKFHKMEAVGQIVTGKANNDPGEWAATDIIAKGNKWDFRIPACVKPGPYIIRHEIIALMGASHPNGAQHYPNCINVMVKGSGTDALEGGTKATDFYKANDPGLKLMIYGPINYIIPGPELYTCGAGSGTGKTSTSTTKTSATGTSTTGSSATGTSNAGTSATGTSATGTSNKSNPSTTAPSGGLASDKSIGYGNSTATSNSPSSTSTTNYGGKTQNGKTSGDQSSGYKSSDDQTDNDRKQSGKTYSDNSHGAKTYGGKTYGMRPSFDGGITHGGKTYGGKNSNSQNQDDESHKDKTDGKTYGEHTGYGAPKSNIATGGADDSPLDFDIPEDATVQQLVDLVKKILAALKKLIPSLNTRDLSYRRHSRDVAA